MPNAPLLGAERDAAPVELHADAFGAPFRSALVHEVVRAELAARRRGTASTRTRGQVAGGNAKPWRQKGTGRARAGSTRSPLWAGGGTIFGPTPRSYVLKVNRRARQAALCSALSLHAARGSLALVDAAAISAPSTRAAAALLAAWPEPRPTLVVAAPQEATLAKSFRNLPRVAVLEPDQVGVVDLVRPASLVLSRSAVEALTVRATRPLGRRARRARPAPAAAPSV